MSDESSPRPWRCECGPTVNSVIASDGAVVVPHTGYAANARLIVDAVNEYARRENWRKKYIDRRVDDAARIEGLFADISDLEVERDRLRLALNEVCSRVSVALNCPRNATEEVELLVHDLLGIKERARAAIGEEETR